MAMIAGAAQRGNAKARARRGEGGRAGAREARRRRRMLRAACFLALGGLAACGGDSREAELTAASERLSAAHAEVQQARSDLEQARAVEEGAKQHLREAEARLAEAESQVDLRATDTVLFRAIQKRLLEDDELEELAIVAQVERGVVTLRGEVPGAELRDHALEIARATPGVVSVESEIRVVPREESGS